MLCTLKKTFDLILLLNCHFLAQVKRNCRKLWEIVALYTAFNYPISVWEYCQKAHGRTVYRRVELYENQTTLPKGWNGITRFVKVRRWGEREGKPFHEVSFYVLSKPIDEAWIVGRAIQAHWKIENELHWIKDVNLGEDDMTLTNENGMAALLVFLNNMAINTLRAAGLKPIKDTFSNIANKVKELIKLF
ncbi:MAG: ISAs1 family transposase [Oscillatoriales cyanobacterium]|jgi:predicted transposase YbfD/YdcC|nr:MAG: ISAs1 family transposase [Oscillatoriales cyanobacterium]